MIKIKTGVFTQEQVNKERKKQEFKNIGDEDYLDIKKVMEWLPLSAQTIIKYIRIGRIKGRKIGIKWYVSKINFYKFLNGK